MRWLDPEYRGIAEFMDYAREQIETGALVLDVGCGQGPYRSWFAHTRYVGTDCVGGGEVAFLSQAETLPMKTGAVDAVILTQVLAYTKEPAAVLEEINRVLRRGGRIFLTDAQEWGLHRDPPDYYRFTQFGLEYLLERAGFKVIFIRARGGYFWYLAKRLSRLPGALFPATVRPVWRILAFLPRAVLARIVGLLLPPLCILLDRLDHERDYTLGYACYAVKSESKNG